MFPRLNSFHEADQLKGGSDPIAAIAPMDGMHHCRCLCTLATVPRKKQYILSEIGCLIAIVQASTTESAILMLCLIQKDLVQGKELLGLLMPWLLEELLKM